MPLNLYNRALVMLLALVLTACVSPSTPGFTSIELPTELNESSGLVCISDEFISFNDSGGAAVVYRFDATGRIKQRLELAVRNIDWEAITSDGSLLYLADTGNNAGKRSSIVIHKVPLDWSSLNQPYVPETLHIDLPEQAQVQTHQHDMDFEALVYHSSDLWLFSKSWASQHSKVYRLDPRLTQQILPQTQAIVSADFLVTDASIDTSTENWWLVGYSNPFKAIWAYLTGAGFQVKLARYDVNFKQIAQKNVPTQGQVEGLCIDQLQQIWLTEEGSEQSPARLINTGLGRKLHQDKLR